MEGNDRSAASAAMDRYANGDDAAFGIVYDALAPRLYPFLLRKTRDVAHAEDLVQQTFLQMHCARATYATGADVVPWAFAIARRLAIDAFRRGDRERVSDDGASFEDALVSELCPDGALRTKQAALVIRRTLESLPEPQRAAFELLKLEGMTLAQAAETLGDSVPAVKLRAHRAYEALRAALAAAT
ncbi:MAG TPA: RNA polymerase sigma factor [Polyangiaceae bacterium]|nr:RNA polymerase sigma factor [Polyangiaceae bacterium]